MSNPLNHMTPIPSDGSLRILAAAGQPAQALVLERHPEWPVQNISELFQRYNRDAEVIFQFIICRISGGTYDRLKVLLAEWEANRIGGAK